MKGWPYHIVDVFTERPFGGNPLAVFPRGEHVPEKLMQAIANEFNLSETTFVLPSQEAGCDFRLRIFTPQAELPMAGHPTIGSAFVLAAEGLIATGGEASTITFEEGVGPIPVRLESGRGGAPGMISMRQPKPVFGPLLGEREALAQMLSLTSAELAADLPCQVVSCGLPFLFIPVSRLDSVGRIELHGDQARRLLSQVEAAGVFVFTRETVHKSSSVHSRMFAPGLGVWEDPATGSASGPLGAYLVTHSPDGAEEVSEFISEQGLEMGRESFVHITIEQTEGSIEGVVVGGYSVSIGQGRLNP